MESSRNGVRRRTNSRTRRSGDCTIAVALSNVRHWHQTANFVVLQQDVRLDADADAGNGKQLFGVEQVRYGFGDEGKYRDPANI